MSKKSDKRQDRYQRYESTRTRVLDVKTTHGGPEHEGIERAIIAIQDEHPELKSRRDVVIRALAEVSGVEIDSGKKAKS